MCVCQFRVLGGLDGFLDDGRFCEKVKLRWRRQNPLKRIRDGRNPDFLAIQLDYDLVLFVQAAIKFNLIALSPRMINGLERTRT